MRMTREPSAIFYPYEAILFSLYRGILFKWLRSLQQRDGTLTRIEDEWQIVDGKVQRNENIEMVVLSRTPLIDR